jgi:hypothetical protein
MGMGERMIRHSILLDSFRDVWIRGRLDYQRASDALDAAIRSAEAMRLEPGVEVDEQLDVANQCVEAARRRLSEVAFVLEQQFNQFCGVEK